VIHNAVDRLELIIQRQGAEQKLRARPATVRSLRTKPRWSAGSTPMGP
jgi:hypothetical protein